MVFFLPVFFFSDKPVLSHRTKPVPTQCLASVKSCDKHCDKPCDKHCDCVKRRNAQLDMQQMLKSIINVVENL